MGNNITALFSVRRIAFLTVLAIIGILLAAIIALVVILLLSCIRVSFIFTTKGRPELKVRLLFITLFDLNKPKKKKKNKKPSKIGEFFKKRFGFGKGLDKEDIKSETVKEGVADKVTKFVTVFMLLADQVIWLVKRIKLKKFDLDVICGGGDAADAAIEYGIVCSTVYPFIGYLETNFKCTDKALDVNIGCDFENDAYFGVELTAKLRIIHIVRALFRSAVNLAKEQTEANQ